MMGKKILGGLLLLAGFAFGAGCFFITKKIGIVEAAVLCGLIGLGAWILDSPDVQAFLEKAKGFLPGKQS